MLLVEADDIILQPVLLQQIAEVQVLLIRHVCKTILTVNLGTGFVEIAVHRVVDEFPGKASSLALITLLLLQPGDVDDLENDYTPENAPNDQDSFESVDLPSSERMYSMKRRRYLRIGARTSSRKCMG